MLFIIVTSFTCAFISSNALAQEDLQENNESNGTFTLPIQVKAGHTDFIEFYDSEFNPIYNPDNISINYSDINNLTFSFFKVSGSVYESLPKYTFAIKLTEKIAESENTSVVYASIKEVYEDDYFFNDFSLCISGVYQYIIPQAEIFINKIDATKPLILSSCKILSFYDHSKCSSNLPNGMSWDSTTNTLKLNGVNFDNYSEIVFRKSESTLENIDNINVVAVKGSINNLNFCKGLSSWHMGLLYRCCISEESLYQNSICFSGGGSINVGNYSLNEYCVDDVYRLENNLQSVNCVISSGTFDINDNTSLSLYTPSVSNKYFNEPNKILTVGITGISGGWYNITGGSKLNIDLGNSNAFIGGLGAPSRAGCLISGINTKVNIKTGDVINSDVNLAQHGMSDPPCSIGIYTAKIPDELSKGCVVDDYASLKIKTGKVFDIAQYDDFLNDIPKGCSSGIGLMDMYFRQPGFPIANSVTFGHGVSVEIETSDAPYSYCVWKPTSCNIGTNNFHIADDLILKLKSGNSFFADDGLIYRACVLDAIHGPFETGHSVQFTDGNNIIFDDDINDYIFENCLQSPEELSAGSWYINQKDMNKPLVIKNGNYPKDDPIIPPFKPSNTDSNITDGFMGELISGIQTGDEMSLVLYALIVVLIAIVSARGFYLNDFLSVNSDGQAVKQKKWSTRSEIALYWSKIVIDVKYAFRAIFERRH